MILEVGPGLVPGLFLFDTVNENLDFVHFFTSGGLSTRGGKFTDISEITGESVTFRMWYAKCIKADTQKLFPIEGK